MYKLISAIVLMGSVSLALCTSSPAIAVGNIDQSVSGTLNWNSGLTSTQSVGQTFTAGISGQLDRVTIDIGKSGTPGTFFLEIFEVSGGFPTGNALASQAVSETLVTNTISTVIVDFTSPATIVSGTRYALFLRAPSAVSGGMMSPSSSYSVGVENNPLSSEGIIYNTGSWSSSANDARFATYVTPIVVPVVSSPSTTPVSPPETLATTGIDLVWITTIGLMTLALGLLGLKSGAKRNAK
jgi:hypothetical protein